MYFATARSACVAARQNHDRHRAHNIALQTKYFIQRKSSVVIDALPIVDRLTSANVYERPSATDGIQMVHAYHRKPDGGFPSTISISRFSQISSARRFSSK